MPNSRVRSASTSRWPETRRAVSILASSSVTMPCSFPVAPIRVPSCVGRYCQTILMVNQGGVDGKGHERPRGPVAACDAMTMHAPHIEAAPWDEQVALDDAAYRAQVAYLFERSPFYRDKLRARASDAADRRRARRDRRAAASPRRTSSARAATPDNPIGAHLAAPMAEIVRIYSTSGTTGTPSYIPLTASDLDNWIEISPRSYAASGLRRGRAHRLDLQRGPVRRRRRARRLRPHRPLPHPGRHREHRAADGARSSCSSPTRLVLHAVLRRSTSPSGRRRAASTSRGSSVERVLVAGEPGGGEPAFRARLEDGWGARVTEAMGIGDIGVSLWGECEEQDGMHFSGARLRPRRADRPRDRRAASRWRTAPTASSSTPTSRHRAAPLLRFRTRDHVRVAHEPLCRAAAPRRACAASAAPTTC